MPECKRHKRGHITVLFRRDEVEGLAEAATAAAIAGAVVPDPGASKAIAACGGLLALLARRAKRKDKGLLVVVWYRRRLGPIRRIAVPTFFLVDDPPAAA